MKREMLFILFIQSLIRLLIIKSKRRDFDDNWSSADN